MLISKSATIQEYKIPETGICAICGGTYDNYGNNPDPIVSGGQCCNSCNEKFVIPSRFMQMQIHDIRVENMTPETFTCVVCGETVKDYGIYPVREIEQNKCCGSCSWDKTIKELMAQKK